MSTDGVGKKRLNRYLSLKAMAYGPTLAQLVITRRCNIDCGYCNEYDKTSPPVPKETIKAWVDKVASFGLYAIEYTGGETLLHPDLLELVRYASAYKFPERWIITNGYLLSEKIIDGLNEGGLTHLQVSVDGLEPNETTVKVLKPVRKKLELLAKHAKFKVQVNAVLGASSSDETLAVAMAVRDLGFKPRIVVVHDDHGGMKLGTQGFDLLVRLHEAVGTPFNESGDYRKRLLSEGRADFKCRAGARYLYIDEYGLVNWCSQQRGVFTKPIVDYTWADLKEQFETKKGCAPTCTVGCVRTASRFDEWRGQPRDLPQQSRAPAINEDALIPASSLVGRRPEPHKRSQADWRREREQSRASGG